jgi:hypothetical protein
VDEARNHSSKREVGCRSPVAATLPFHALNLSRNGFQSASAICWRLELGEISDVRSLLLSRGKLIFEWYTSGPPRAEMTDAMWGFARNQSKTNVAFQSGRTTSVSLDQ